MASPINQQHFLNISEQLRNTQAVILQSSKGIILLKENLNLFRQRNQIGILISIKHRLAKSKKLLYLETLTNWQKF
jgi:hypothetical protein